MGGDGRGAIHHCVSGIDPLVIARLPFLGGIPWGPNPNTLNGSTPFWAHLAKIPELFRAFDSPFAVQKVQKLHFRGDLSFGSTVL